MGDEARDIDERDDVEIDRGRDGSVVTLIDVTRFAAASCLLRAPCEAAHALSDSEPDPRREPRARDSD